MAVTTEQKLDSIFAFRLGQIVSMSSDVERCTSELKLMSHRGRLADVLPLVPTYTVVDRRVEQCHGGVQLHYSVRHKGSDGKIYTTLLGEPELVDYTAANKELLRLYTSLEGGAEHKRGSE